MTPDFEVIFTGLVGEIEASKKLYETLKPGVSVELAYAVIDETWTGNEASDIKTRLCSSFPKENSEAILRAPLPAEFSGSSNVSNAKCYLVSALEEITANIKNAEDFINQRDINDPEAIIKMNEFRKEPARFIDLIKEGWVPNKEQLLNGEITSWQDFVTESETVDSGNYLFLNDYRGELKEAFGKFEESFFGRNDLSTCRIGDIGNYVERLLVVIKVVCMFNTFLINLTK